MSYQTGTKKFIWEREFDKSPHHLFLKDTIEALYNLLPDTNNYAAARLRLSNNLEFLWYTSYKDLRKLWGNIYTTIVTLIPLHLPIHRSNEWLIKLHSVWNTAQHKRRCQYPLSTSAFYTEFCS